MLTQSEQPVPVSNHSFRAEIFLNIQPESPLLQPEAIRSSIASYMEEVDSHHSTTSFKVVVEISMVTSEHPLLQTK